ncbi:hypothetical protein [Rothia terrae]|uniref:Holin n=1 Tax=Rothia terrae TaxID=396015 RepID=A0A7H2BGA9_9MICC|nr:hypothetical protein [Rothia terrae]QNV38705.1 hypothetical protein IDM49_05550 [Rothia terrae]
MEEQYKDTISPAARKAIYWVYFAVTLVVGSCQAYVAAIGAAQPNWITGALAVLAYAGAMLGLQAAVFTPKTPVSAVKPVDDGVATIEPVDATTIVEENQQDMSGGFEPIPLDSSGRVASTS